MTTQYTEEECFSSRIWESLRIDSYVKRLIRHGGQIYNDNVHDVWDADTGNKGAWVIVGGQMRASCKGKASWLTVVSHIRGGRRKKCM